MDLDGAFSLLALLLHWRVVVCVFASSALAYLLVSVFPWFSAGQGIAIALIGILPGAIWEANSYDTKTDGAASPSETSSSVAGLTSILVGAGWGSLSGGSVHAFLAGAAIFFVAAKFWGTYARVQLKLENTGRIASSIFLAALAYPVGALIGHFALSQETPPK